MIASFCMQVMNMLGYMGKGGFLSFGSEYFSLRDSSLGSALDTREPILGEEHDVEMKSREGLGHAGLSS